jgi:hypothetical protein
MAGEVLVRRRGWRHERPSDARAQWEAARREDVRLSAVRSRERGCRRAMSAAVLLASADESGPCVGNDRY